jgi:hypothetical protein
MNNSIRKNAVINAATGPGIFIGVANNPRGAGEGDCSGCVMCEGAHVMAGAVQGASDTRIEKHSTSNIQWTGKLTANER